MTDPLGAATRPGLDPAPREPMGGDQLRAVLPNRRYTMPIQDSAPRMRCLTPAHGRPLGATVVTWRLASYGGDEAVIAIATGQIIAGWLPGRALRLVREWTRMHHDELNANWDLARARQAPVAITPLP